MTTESTGTKQSDYPRMNDSFYKINNSSPSKGPPIHQQTNDYTPNDK